MLKSQTEVPLTIVGAMAKADDLLGSARLWSDVNDKQKLFIDKFFETNRMIVEKIKEIKSIASASSDDVNRFLRENGSSASIGNLARNEIAIASIMDIAVEWIRIGSNVDIETPDKKKYKGVRIGKDGVRFYVSGNHNHPIARLVTKTEDMVHLTILDDKDAKFVSGEFNLHGKIESMMKNKDPCFDFEGLKFPKVDLDQVKNMNWLIGINTKSSKGDPAVIKYAYQKNRLRMNEVGARFQSEFRGGMMLMATMQKHRPDHIIDRPFLCWITRKGFPNPLFAAYVSKDNWKDPGDI